MYTNGKGKCGEVGEGEQLQKPESVNQFPSASARHEMQVINFDVSCEVSECKFVNDSIRIL